MFEKVSPYHIDKVADRIAGAMVDLAYLRQDNPKVAVEVLIGHGDCYIIAESSYVFKENEVRDIVSRITGNKFFNLTLKVVPQDPRLAENQEGLTRCGDNGIFKGCKISEEERMLSRLAKEIYNEVIESDGKYLVDGDSITICQSGIEDETKLKSIIADFLAESSYDYDVSINPLGYWEADLDNDTGVTGRKLGSDLGRGATSGAICGKDLSKADVTVNIFLYLILNRYKLLYALISDGSTKEALSKLKQIIDKQNITELETSCSIGDATIEVLGVYFYYPSIVDAVRSFIDIIIGGFEKLAMWGLM